GQDQEHDQIFDGDGHNMDFRTFEFLYRWKPHIAFLFIFPGGEQFANLHGDDVSDDTECNARHDRRADEDNRHEWRHPEGIGLDRSKNKTGIAVQETGYRDADTGQNTHRLLVLVQRLRAEIHGTHGEERIEGEPERFDSASLLLGP